MKYLIAGLGNIGPEYHETRHNIGFMVVDALAQAAGITFNDGRYGFTATMSVKGRQLILLKPSTFMNLSGNNCSRSLQKRTYQYQWCTCKGSSNGEAGRCNTSTQTAGYLFFQSTTDY